MRRLHILSIILLLSAVAVGCKPESQAFDPDDLVGKWHVGTLYYRYDDNGSGATWDTADDVAENEAQPFSWELVNNRLTQYHHTEMGAVVPKTYYLKTLTASQLSYEDSYGNLQTFSRI